MPRAAKPMIWPYLRTGAPSGIGSPAICCPRGMRSRAAVPAARAPAATASMAMTTLSCGERRTTRGAVTGTSQHLVVGRVDQVHVVEVGVEPHGLARAGGGRRLDPAAYLGVADGEEHHRLHAHGP